MIDTQELLVPTSATRPPCIGIFDSGVGGLSILRALRDRVVDASMIYVGDVAHAPYGDRSEEHVVERSQAVAAWLIDQGASLIVIACNTATVLAIESLRARWPSIVFVGVEPGVKPAAARSRNRRIGVMATAATARSARLRHLIERYAGDAHVHVQACPGLADAIERGVVGGAELRALLMPHCDALRAAAIDTVVLGCTHYPFVEAAIRESLGPDIAVIDTATAVAERTASLWEGLAPAFDEAPLARAISTGASATMAQLLLQCPGLETTEVEVLTIIPCRPPG